MDALNLQERQEELYEKYLFPSHTIDRGDNLATLINNHSIMIQTKAPKPTEVLLKEMKITADSDGQNATTSRMDVELMEKNIKKRKRLEEKARDQEEAFKGKFDSNQQKELEMNWKEFTQERKKKLDRRA